MDEEWNSHFLQGVSVVFHMPINIFAPNFFIFINFLFDNLVYGMHCAHLQSLPLISPNSRQASRMPPTPPPALKCLFAWL